MVRRAPNRAGFSDNAPTVAPLRRPCVYADRIPWARLDTAIAKRRAEFKVLPTAEADKVKFDGKRSSRSVLLTATSSAYVFMCVDPAP